MCYTMIDSGFYSYFSPSSSYRARRALVQKYISGINVTVPSETAEYEIIYLFTWVSQHTQRFQKVTTGWGKYRFKIYLYCKTTLTL